MMGYLKILNCIPDTDLSELFLIPRQATDKPHSSLI